MLINNKSPEDVIDLHVVTWNDDEYRDESALNFIELQDSLVEQGIRLTYAFEEHHDRFIKANNSWKITLGRGLDIFEKIDGRFDVALMDQSKRKCKSCEITYLRVS